MVKLSIIKTFIEENLNRLKGRNTDTKIINFQNFTLFFFIILFVYLYSHKKSNNEKVHFNCMPFFNRHI